MSGAPTTIFMRQKRAVFGEAVETFDVLAKAFGLPQKAFEVPGLRPTPVSTGARHLMIPIIDLAALRAATMESTSTARGRSNPTISRRGPKVHSPVGIRVDCKGALETGHDAPASAQ